MLITYEWEEIVLMEEGNLLEMKNVHSVKVNVKQQ